MCLNLSTIIIINITSNIINFIYSGAGIRGVSCLFTSLFQGRRLIFGSGAGILGVSCIPGEGDSSFGGYSFPIVSCRVCCREKHRAQHTNVQPASIGHWCWFCLEQVYSIVKEILSQALSLGKFGRELNRSLQCFHKTTGLRRASFRHLL